MRIRRSQQSQQRPGILSIGSLAILCLSTPLTAQTVDPPTNTPSAILTAVSSPTPLPFPSDLSFPTTPMPVPSPRDISFPTTMIPTAGEAIETLAPIDGPETLAPIDGPETLAPIDGPETLAPIDGPETVAPIDGPETLPPSMSPMNSTGVPVIPTATPSENPSNLPTISPSTSPTPAASAFPTALPTATPSSVPSKIPTKSPSAVPTTMFPSESPTVTRDLVPQEAIVPLELQVTVSELTGEVETDFTSTTEAFLAEELPEVTLISVVVDRQYRKSEDEERRRILQAGEPLFVDLGISARLIDEDPDYDFEAVLVQLFETESEKYIFDLKLANPVFFQPLNEVVVNQPDTESPTSAPTSLPPTGGGGDDDDESSFSLGAIIGIAVVGFIILALGGWFIKDRMSKQSRPTKREEPSTPLADADSKAPQNQEIPHQRDSDLESQGLYSYLPGDTSVMGGSIMQNESIVGMDTASYAYSLEPGVDSNTVDGSYANTVPMEIPQFNPQRTESDALQSYVSSTRDSEFGAEPTLDNQSVITTDLKLTESELAMLPSDLGKDTSEADHEDPPTRQVIAPAGKLGIVIDTTVEGPVVHYVNETSALLGKVFAGDVIIAIDDVDTRAMSASAITDLMVKTANQKRRLTIAGKGEP